jgi:hypothetical protein
MISYCYRTETFSFGGYGIRFIHSEEFPDLAHFSNGTDQEVIVMNVYEFNNSRDYYAAQGIEKKNEKEV